METLARLLTNEAEAAILLRRILPGFRDGGWQLLSCRLEHARRRISRRIREQGGAWLGVVWRLEVRDPASGAAGEQWLYAKAYTHGASEAAWRAAQTTACVRPRFATPIEHFAQLDVVLWALPNDPMLTQLPAFLEGRALAAHLPPALSPDPGTALLGRIVRHEPEEHCTARFEGTHDAQPIAFYGKAYADDARWRDARDTLDALWRQSLADRAAFATGRPMGCSPGLKAVWQQEVRGAPLIERLLGRQAEQTVALLASALHRFQSDGPGHGRSETPGQSIALARKWRNKLSQADVRLQAMADAVFARLAADPPSYARPVPVHGDFHADQMLWADGRVALFDYDNLALGSETRDLADFMSQLLTRDEHHRFAAAISRSLLAQYRHQASSSFDQRELEWQLRLMLLRKAYSFFVRSQEGWQSRARSALALALAGTNCFADASLEMVA